MMSLRRRLMQLKNEESYVYIPNYKPAYLSANTSYNIVGASYNNLRIGFFGAGNQAGIYTTRSNDVTYVQPVIKMPNGTKSITISFESVTRLYNNDDVYVYWMKDTSSGTTYPTCALCLAEVYYDARGNSAALKTNTLTVPEGADSFVGFFRIYPSIGENETAESIANDIGFSITFNKS